MYKGCICAEDEHMYSCPEPVCHGGIQHWRNLLEVSLNKLVWPLILHYCTLI